MDDYLSLAQAGFALYLHFTSGLGLGMKRTLDAQRALVPKRSSGGIDQDPESISGLVL